MSFTGDLEHLSIVDVVQLLHATRKSGTLTVAGGKGSAQLVFSDGYIVSANHFDERLRIGTILVEAGVLPGEELERALAEQKAAGDRRRPLVAALIESGRVKKEDAFRGLESLIELTIVDILTWKAGSFTLDVADVAVADEYRYFPEKLHQDMQFHAENVLMEALRIFDEKKRDGRLQEREQAAEEAADVLALTEDAAIPDDETSFAEGVAPHPEGVTPLAEGVVPLAEEVAPHPEGVIPLTEDVGLALSPDDLGLENVEGLERRIPAVFAPLRDGQERPAGSPHRAAIRDAAPEIPEEGQRALAAFLDALPRPAAAPGIAPAVILLGANALLAYCLTEVCRRAGVGLFATTDPEDVLPYAEHQHGKGRVPLLVQDLDGLAGAGLAPLRWPHLGTVALAGGPPPGDAAVTAFLRLPPLDGGEGSLAALVRFLKDFPGAIGAHARQQASFAAAAARRCAGRLSEARDAPAVAQAVLASVADLGARALVLVLRGEDLVTGTGIALHAPGATPAAAPGIRIPLAQAPLLRQAVETGRCAIVPAVDPAAAGAIGAVIGAPADPVALVVPLAAAGRTASLVVGDFGPGPAAPPPLDLLETFAAQAGAALELFLARRRLDKAGTVIR